MTLSAADLIGHRKAERDNAPVVWVVDVAGAVDGLQPVWSDQYEHHAAPSDGAGDPVGKGFPVLDRRRVYERALVPVAPCDFSLNVTCLPRVLAAPVADEER